MLIRTILAALPLMLLVSACSALAETPTTPPGSDAVYTQIAETIIAQVTLSAGQTAVAELTRIAATPTPPTDSQPGPTATLPEVAQPDPTATSTPTQQPSPTPLPTSTPTVPPTPTPTVTPVPIPCDWAQFVTDITVKDGTTFVPDEPFTKTWRLRNIGSCTWTTSYALVFVDGARMGSPGAINLPANVRPGETVDLSVNLVAPSQTGSYTGYWQLRNAGGVLFGVGRDARQSFWMSIQVIRRTAVVFDFITDYCRAEWRSGDQGVMACPSLPGLDSSPEAGAVFSSSAPTIENGTVENEAALITFPSQGDGGKISGKYPTFRVQSGDRFRAVIGCIHESYNCNVIYQLNYSVDGGPLQNLWSWTEVYDQSVYKVDLDLSSLAGKSVSFVLTVLNNGSNVDDWAFWLLPRIVR